MTYLRWRPEFERALDRRFYPIEHLDRLIADGRASLWAGVGAAIVTEVQEFPSGARAIHGLVAAGDLDEIVRRLIPMAEAAARAAGCDFALIASRPGWGRQLRRRGYAPFQQSIVKTL